MSPEYALLAPPVQEHRAYRLSEWAVNAAFAVIGAFMRSTRRISEQRQRARLVAETRHLDERLLRDIGLWDKLR